MSSDPSEYKVDHAFLKTLELSRKAQMMKTRLQKIGSKITPVCQESADLSSDLLACTPALELPTARTCVPDLVFSTDPNASISPPKPLIDRYVGRVIGKRKADRQTITDEKEDGQRPRLSLYQYLLTHQADSLDAFHTARKMSTCHNQGGNIRHLGSRGSFGRSTSITIRLSPTSILVDERSDKHASAPPICSLVAEATNSFTPHPKISQVVHPYPEAQYSMDDEPSPDLGKADNTPSNVYPDPPPTNPSAISQNLPSPPCSPTSILSFPSSFASTEVASTPSPTSATKRSVITADLLPPIPTPLSIHSRESERHIENLPGLTSPSPTLAPRFQPPTGPTASWPDFGYLGSTAGRGVEREERLQ